MADTLEPIISLRDASHITLRGLLITINSGPGIRIEGGEHNMVAGCTIRLVDEYGVRVEGGKSHTVRSSELTKLGSGGAFSPAGMVQQARVRRPAMLS